jgi:hypothetical protein
MAQIRAIEARGLLDILASEAKSKNADLIDYLRAARNAIANNSFRQGRIYVSTSGSGQSHSFLVPSQLTADFTPTRIFAQFQEFVEIYNDALANGLITDASDADADAAVMAQDDRLYTVTDRRLDLTGLRFPATSAGNI